MLGGGGLTARGWEAGGYLQLEIGLEALQETLRLMCEAPGCSRGEVQHLADLLRGQLHDFVDCGATGLAQGSEGPGTIGVKRAQKGHPVDDVPPHS